MIYLDHAATSWPKPPEVLRAVGRWFEQVGVSADRGEGPATGEARRTVAAARAALAGMTGTRDERIAFVSGATEGLNLALRALLRPGDSVATTCLEHSSVVRPLLALAAERGLRVLPPPDDADPDSCAAHLAQVAERDRPTLLVFTHASNVTGACLDAVAVCEAARRQGVRTLLDASQTAGLVPIDVGADVVVASAHKALHGPPGLGFVAVREGVDLAPQKQGGTGSSAALDRHPEAWPLAFEAGTPNTPAIFGLVAALSWLASKAPGEALAQSLAALDRAAHGLASLAGVRRIGVAAGRRVPVLSFVHDRYDPLELGAILAGAGVHVRAGFHCAPWVHRALGTVRAGTVRISTGPTTTDADVDVLLSVLRSL